MTSLRQLVREIHRRSVWQVLGVYLVGSWGALQVVDVLVDNYGLPDWVPPFALVLLVVGLPIVVATAVVQEGPPSRDGKGEERGVEPGRGAAGEAALLDGEPHPFELPEAEPAAELGEAERRGGEPQGADDEPLHHRLFTWRNAILGGVGAFALLGVAVAAYFLMWSAGIGPVGSLVAQGVLEEGNRVVLADFENATSDPTLGDAVTEALRMDLVESPVLQIVDPGFAREALARMERDPDDALSAGAARELAVREGFKAVIQGEVSRVGSGYVLTASIVGAEEGRTLAGFRVAADDADGIIAAIDELSKRLREKAGESLRSIKGGEPLSRVTTSSLDALTRYSQAVKASEAGDQSRALALFEEAVAEDSTFAMAWRKIGVIHFNRDDDPARMREAITRAYDLRERLTDRERYLATAMYHEGVTGDIDAAIRAYRNVLEIDPDDGIALNNLGFIYLRLDRLQEAERVLRRGVSGPGELSSIYLNLVRALGGQGETEEAWRVALRFADRYPEHPGRFFHPAIVAFWSGAYERTDSILGRALEELEGRDRMGALVTSAGVDGIRGRVGEARRHLRDAGDMAAAQGWAISELRHFQDLAGVERWLARDSATALGILDRAAGRLAENEDGIDSGQPHLELAGEYALLGAAGRAEELLGRYWDALPETGRTSEQERALAIREALVRGARGRHEEALADLRRIRRTDPDCRDRCELGHMARLHDLAGRPDSAVVYYERTLEDERRGFGFFLPYAFLYPYALERLAELHEAAGRHDEARRYYREFAELWADADPELQPRVRRAQERVEVLAASGG